MIKFFRKIRQQLLSENKLSKYLVYAIGEILLVVIGIFIALQANSWREAKKLESLEQSILSDLRSEVNANIDRLDYNIRERENVLQAGKLILEKSGPNGVWDSEVKFDSLLFKVVVSGWKFFPETGVITDVLNSGKLNIIQNDSLRYLISSLPADIKMINDEDDTYRTELHTYIVPFFSKNYPIRDIVNKNGLMDQDMSLGLTDFEADPSTLLRNPELESVLTVQTIWTNTALGFYKEQVQEYQLILDLIDQELE